MVYEILPQEYATSLRFCEKNLYRKYNAHWLKANPVQTVDPVMISIIVCRMHVKHLAVFNLIGNHLFHLCVRKLQCEYKIYPFLCERETWNAATRDIGKMQVFVNPCFRKDLVYSGREPYLTIHSGEEQANKPYRLKSGDASGDGSSRPLEDTLTPSRKLL